MAPPPDFTAVAPVVVTRPRQQALPFASRVQALGRRAEIFPLLDIEALDDPSGLRAVLARLHEFALVVFVSPNAIDAAFAQRPDEGWPSAVAIGVVGEGSRVALCAHGVDQQCAQIYSPAPEARMDSEELLKALPLAQLRGQRVLVVRGQHGRDLLGEALTAHGVQVEFVTAYRRLTPQLTPPLQAQLLGLIDDGAEWIVTSSEALRNLRELARLAGGADRVVKLQRQRLIVSHHRIAQTAHELGFVTVILAGSGDERLLAALQSSP